MNDGRSYPSDNRPLPAGARPQGRRFSPWAGPEAPRVLFVSHTAELGGAELYLLDVARAFRKHAHVLLFSEGALEEHLTAAGVSFSVLPAPPGVLGVTREAGLRDALGAAPGVVRLATQVARHARRFDVIFANTQKALVAAAPASVVARRPLIWNLHDILTADHFSRLNTRLAVGLANRCAQLVITNSEATCDAFVEAGGRVEKTRVVYNGIDLAPFAAAHRDELGVQRRALGLHPRTPLVGVFGRLAPWKGQHVLLGALRRLPGVHALVVGEALFEGDEPYAEQLRREAQAPALAGRVHFLGFRRDVPTLMRLTDIVAHTSVAPEPFGRVIVEALLAERAVVAARAGGASEILHDWQTGVLVEPGCDEALAEAIGALFRNPDRARRLALAGSAEAGHRFSLSTMLGALRQCIDEVARRAPSNTTHEALERDLSSAVHLAQL